MDNFISDYKEALNFLKRNKVKLTDENIAKVMGVSVEELNQYKDNYFVKYNGRENISEEKSAIDKNVFEAELEEFRKIIRKALSPTEMEIIYNYFYDNMTIEQISEKHNIKEGLVFKILQKAFLKIKKTINKKGVEFEQIG